MRHAPLTADSRTRAVYTIIAISIVLALAAIWTFNRNIDLRMKLKANDARVRSLKRLYSGYCRFVTEQTEKNHAIEQALAPDHVRVDVEFGDGTPQDVFVRAGDRVIKMVRRENQRNPDPLLIRTDGPIPISLFWSEEDAKKNERHVWDKETDTPKTVPGDSSWTTDPVSPGHTVTYHLGSYIVGAPNPTIENWLGFSNRENANRPLANPLL